ncbi:MAG: hypothetical protein AB1505_12010 [Candidatus Latescibacterota bacterium]
METIRLKLWVATLASVALAVACEGRGQEDDGDLGLVEPPPSETTMEQADTGYGLGGSSPLTMSAEQMEDARDAAQKLLEKVDGARRAIEDADRDAAEDDLRGAQDAIAVLREASPVAQAAEGKGEGTVYGRSDSASGGLHGQADGSVHIPVVRVEEDKDLIWPILQAQARAGQAFGMSGGLEAQGANPFPEPGATSYGRADTAGGWGGTPDTVSLGQDTVDTGALLGRAEPWSDTTGALGGTDFDLGRDEGTTPGGGSAGDVAALAGTYVEMDVARAQQGLDSAQSHVEGGQLPQADRALSGIQSDAVQIRFGAEHEPLRQFDLNLGQAGAAMEASRFDEAGQALALLDSAVAAFAQSAPEDARKEIDKTRAEIGKWSQDPQIHAQEAEGRFGEWWASMAGWFDREGEVQYDLGGEM